MQIEECQVDNIDLCSSCGYDCYMYHSMKSLVHLANIPAKYKDTIQLEAVGREVEVFKELRDYGNNIKDHVSKGQGLFLYSETKGNGKTSWAIRLMRLYLQAVALETDLNVSKAVYVNVPTFMAQTKNNISEYDEELYKLREKIQSSSLVVWDDIGRESATDYSRETLYSLINHQYESKLCQIFTSNHDITSLSKPSRLGTEIMDRVLEHCKPIKFTGKRRREDKAWWNTK